MKRPTIKKIESVEDLRDETFSEIFEFTDIHGQLRHEAIPRGDISNPRKVRDMFYGKGLPPTDASLDDFATLIKSAAPRRMKRPRGFGWADDETYILPNDVIGRLAHAGVEWGQPSFQPQSYALSRSRSGDVGSWLADVALECVRSSVGTVALCAAFAAPLLKCANGPSFTINLSGPSKSGKSTLLCGAGSVSGVGQESDLPNFNGTASAMNELLILYKDQLLPLNELGLVRGGRTKVYDVVRDLTYAIAEGRARTNNAKSPYADAAVTGQFKTIAVLTAERSIQQYAEDAAADRDGGEFARLFDLTVRRGPQQSIFDLAPSDEQTAEAVSNRCQRILDSVSRHHGVALPEFIKHLLDKGANLSNLVRTLQSEFVASIDQGELPDAAWRHACQSFGILFAGGVLAIEACLLPLEKEELLKILGSVFLDAARCQPPVAGSTPSQPASDDPAKLLTGALQRLKREGLLVKWGAGSSFSASTVGYWERVQGRIVYTMHTASFRRALGGDQRLEAVLLFLRGRNAFIGQKSSKALKGSVAEQCTTYARWPNGKRFRAFRIARQMKRVM